MMNNVNHDISGINLPVIRYIIQVFCKSVCFYKYAHLNILWNLRIINVFLLLLLLLLLLLSIINRFHS